MKSRLQFGRKWNSKKHRLVPVANRACLNYAHMESAAQAELSKTHRGTLLYVGKRNDPAYVRN